MYYLEVFGIAAMFELRQGFGFFTFFHEGVCFENATKLGVSEASKCLIVEVQR